MKVIYDGLILRAALPSGTGHDLLTIDPITKQITSISGTPLTATLTDSHILVGNSSNIAADVAMTGDITINNAGVTAIGTGVIVNADVNASAAIGLTKLAPQTANLAAVFNSSGFLEPSTVTTTELSYSSGLSGNIQGQLNTKQIIITGGASSITTTNLTANHALISNASGKVAISPTTDTELGYVSGVTSPIQGQLNQKLTVSLTTPTAGDMLWYNGSAWTNFGIGTEGQVITSQSGVPTWDDIVGNGLPSGGSAGQYLNKIDGTDYNAQWSTLDLSKITDVTALAADVNLLFGLEAAGLTGIELGYVNGVTSPIQTQLDNKLSRSLTYNSLFVGDAANLATMLPPGTDDQVLTIVSGAPAWQDPSPPGDVSGVGGTSTDNAVVRWNGTAGNSIQDSGVIMDDSDNISGVSSLEIKNQGALILKELTANGVNNVSIEAAGSMSADYTITLPAAAPADNTFLKHTTAGTYVWDAGGGGASAFTDLTDTPSSYSGQSLKGVRVNAGETALEFYTIGSGTVTSVSGTTNRITSTGGTTPVIDISAAYVGQTSITTLGTIGTGAWNATNISLAKGGTGASLTDPGADRILFWDESANAVTWLTAGSGLTISGTTITADGVGVGTAGQSLITSTGGAAVWSDLIIEDVSGLTYSFTADDNGKLKRFTNASGCTATIPTGLPTGWQVLAYRANGAGTTTFASSGTLEGVGTTLPAAKTMASIIHRGSDVHVLTGAVTAVGTGTVTSVGLSGISGIISVGSSPIVTSGTMTLSLDNQTANTGFWGPSSGSAAAPTFRAMVLADLPNESFEDVTGTTYSFVEADNHKIKRFTNAAGCTVTIPTGLTTGWTSTMYRGDGAGTVTFGSSGTLESTATTLSTAKTAATVLHRGSDIHVVIGALSAGGSGSVTSVAMSVPSFLSVSGSPITTSGTLAVTLSGTALPAANGGTGLTSIGAANQILAVNNAGSALEYKTLSVSSTAVANDVGVTLTGANAIVINVPSASPSDRGVVTTGTQSFGGAKTHTTVLNINGASGGNILTLNNNAGTNRWTIAEDGSLTMSTSSLSNRLLIPNNSTGIFKGHTTSSSVSSFTILNSSSQDAIQIRGTGTIAFGNASERPKIGPGGASSYSIVGESLRAEGVSGGSSGSTVMVIETTTGASSISGGSTHYGVRVLPSTTFTNSGGGASTINSIAVQPIYNFTANTTTIRGIYYNPTETSLTGVTHYGVIVNSTTALNGFGLSAPTATLHTRGANNGLAFKAEDDSGNRILELGESGGSRYVKIDFGSDATADIYRRNSSGNLQRLALGSALQVLRVNAGATDIEWGTASGGGITNSATNNEMMKSDDTNAVPSGIFSNTQSNLTLGDSSISGASRVITAAGSATNIGLYLGAKAEPVFVQNELAVYDTSNGFTLGSEVGRSIYITAKLTNHTLGGGDGDSANLKDFDIKAADGFNATASGRSLNLYGGDAFGTGNLNGGNVTITSGAKNGSGTDGNITIDALTGYLILSNIPTSSAGLPSGAVWSNSNVLTIVP